MSGHVYKRCSCPVLRDEQGRKIVSPKAHGSWTYVADVPVDDGSPRRQVVKDGFMTKRDAEAALRRSSSTPTGPGRPSDADDARGTSLNGLRPDHLIPLPRCSPAASIEAPVLGRQSPRYVSRPSRG